ncbi:MAG: glycosyltransferase family 9 protein [Candidatus Cloacimonetes bacterium]|jgi:ADP-heptose:LPS heptosyltransferase|nr:glycosyltransferase family 9 protein [Candidatus Cloacimonadota bacterium]MCK9434295.1 glycosyltransferase family 9 protein [Candidatus Cloacimonadota bacterium]MDD3547812.1 glycosyltransferase family 9 protein [Candidatus Cloacimonadota bacterium]MDD4233458.1 glycosyltransferase family 9 protein [Candidatus Cloacimonadota bacterium]MDD4814727.1 glycosyltransferase family 9 protein [Candidatus Cloacimonadota bacterium]
MGTKAKSPVIIISRTDRLGDLLLSFPAIHLVREMHPNAKIILLVRRYTKDLLYGQNFIDKILCVDEYSQADLVKILQNEHPDWFVALYTDKFVGYLARMSKAKYRIGPLSKMHSWLVYNYGVWQKRSRGIKNEAEYNLDLVKKISPQFQIAQAYTCLYFGEEHREAAMKALPVDFSMHQHRLVIINPFGGGSAKNISLEEYRKLGDILATSLPNCRIIYLARNEEETAAIMAGKDTAQSVFMNTGSILNLVALIDLAQLYIGPSTGPTHIAAFLDKPVVAIYPRIRNQSPIRWGVIGNKYTTYVQPPIPCPQKYGCRKSCPEYDCFDKIKASEIAEICMKYL